MEDHYVVTGEPNDFYVDRFIPATGRGIDIAQGLWQVIRESDLKSELCLVKADGSNTNTGCKRGAIRNLELLMQRPLQRDTCMLHLNELPPQHNFTVLDGTTKSPHKFSGPVSSILRGLVTQWEVANIKPIPYSSFPFLPNDIINDLY